ncbi:MAG: hypothetical protein ABIG63_02855 [Chloroflexota bacterium]
MIITAKLTNDRRPMTGDGGRRVGESASQRINESASQRVGT